LKLLDRIQDDLKRSLKAKDGSRVSVLRFLLAAVKNREIEKKESLSDDEILAEIASSAKRRRESIEAFKNGDRQDLVDKEEAELAILAEYLPAQMSAEEVRLIAEEIIGAVNARSPADIGAVMKEIMPRVRGKADGKVVNQIVREILGG
jgi:uncharacterized protein YqeY